VVTASCCLLRPPGRRGTLSRTIIQYNSHTVLLHYYLLALLVVLGGLRRLGGPLGHGHGHAVPLGSVDTARLPPDLDMFSLEALGVPVEGFGVELWYEKSPLELNSFEGSADEGCTWSTASTTRPCLGTPIRTLQGAQERVSFLHNLSAAVRIQNSRQTPDSTLYSTLQSTASRAAIATYALYKQGSRAIYKWQGDPPEPVTMEDESCCRSR